MILESADMKVRELWIPPDHAKAYWLKWTDPTSSRLWQSAWSLASKMRWAALHLWGCSFMLVSASHIHTQKNLWYTIESIPALVKCLPPETPDVTYRKFCYASESPSIWALLVGMQIGWEGAGRQENDGLPDFSGAALKGRKKKIAQKCLKLYRRAAEKGALTKDTCDALWQDSWASKYVLIRSGITLISSFNPHGTLLLLPRSLPPAKQA